MEIESETEREERREGTRKMVENERDKTEKEKMGR